MRTQQSTQRTWWRIWETAISLNEEERRQRRSLEPLSSSISLNVSMLLPVALAKIHVIFRRPAAAGLTIFFFCPFFFLFLSFPRWNLHGWHSLYRRVPITGFIVARVRVWVNETLRVHMTAKRNLLRAQKEEIIKKRWTNEKNDDNRFWDIGRRKWKNINLL